MDGLIKAAEASDFLPGALPTVELGGESKGVANVGDKFYTMSAICKV